MFEKKKSKIQKCEICKLYVYYSKNANKTSIQPILKSNSTSFMLNNIFCEMKKLSTVGGGLGEWGNCPNFVLEVLFQYILGYPSNNHTFMLSIGSFHSFIFLSYNLKSEIFWHSKAYSSHSFQPTGIGLGSL